MEARNGDPLDEILVKKEDERADSPVVLRAVEDAAHSAQAMEVDDELNQYYMSLQTAMIREESQCHEDRSSGVVSGINQRSAMHHLVPKKTPSVAATREPAHIRRVEPVLDGALAALPRAATGVVTDIGDVSSLVSKASTGPWANQYSHVRAARRGKAGFQTQTPTPQSSAGAPFAAGGLREQLDLNTE